jgi:hypothetical protein
MVILGCAGFAGVCGAETTGALLGGLCGGTLCGGVGLLTRATSIGVILFFAGSSVFINKSKRWQARENNKKEPIRMGYY